MIVGAYLLNLYCDRSGYSDAKPATCPRDRTPNAIGEFVGRTRTDAIAQARRAGWLVNDNKDVCLCPQCRRATPVPASAQEITPTPTPHGVGQATGDLS